LVKDGLPRKISDSGLDLEQANSPPLGEEKF
jgi:hypothetical protein